MYKNKNYKLKEAESLDLAYLNNYSGLSKIEKERKEKLEIWKIRNRNKFIPKKQKAINYSCLCFLGKKYESFDKELEYFELFRI